jgi:hypothetical protein
MNVPIEQLFPILFPIIGLAAVWQIAKQGGWAKLSEKYSYEASDGVRWKGWQSGSFGLMHYNNCLWVAVQPDGLYLKTGPLFFFRLFHPPLRVPWAAIKSIKDSKRGWSQCFEVRVANPEVTFTIAGQALSAGQNYLEERQKL